MSKKEKELTSIVRIDIPLDSHPDTVKGDTPGSTTARAALQELYDCHGRVNDAAVQVKDKNRLAAAATAEVESSLRRVEKHTSRLNDQIAHLEKGISAALSPPVNPATATEIRQYWSYQKNGNIALIALEKLMGVDAVTTSAVLNAPAYLSGLMPKNIDLLRDIAAKRSVPDEVAARTEARDGLERVTAATERFIGTLSAHIQEWTNNDDAAIATMKGTEK